MSTLPHDDDPEGLHTLLGHPVVEFGATVNAAVVVIGDRLGMYRALSSAGAAETPFNLGLEARA